MSWFLFCIRRGGGGGGGGVIVPFLGHIVCFVDIGGIVDHQCLVFLFMIKV